MARKIINQNTFTAGEIAPELYSRSESEEYKRGIETATNAVITPQGPIRRRSGTTYVAHTKDSSTTSRLIKYQVNKDTAYIIELDNLLMRFYVNGGQITESAKTITGITQADPAVVTSTAHGYSDGDQVYITSVAGMTEINDSNIPYIVANKTANTFEVQDIDGNNVDSSAFTAYSSGGSANKIYTVTTPYTTAQLDEVQWVQSGTSMYLVHSAHEPRTLTRNSDTDWDLDTVTFLPPPTYEAGYSPSTTMTPAATTGTAVNFTAGTGVFLEGDVGRQIVNLSDGETGRASIVSITSTTVAVCDIVEDFTDTNAIASGDWKMDLSPVVDLEFDAIQAGAIVNIRSEYPAGSLGDRITITGITAANPAVVTTSAAHGLVNGDKVVIKDVVGMTTLNNKSFTVDNKTSTTFELEGENSSGYIAYASGGIVQQQLDDIVVDAFRSDDVGKYILANGGVAQVIAVNAADDVDAEIIKSFNEIDTTGNWTLEVATWDATRGYPRAVGIYEQRLVFGGTTAEPQDVWMSEVGIFEGFGVGPDDEDSIQITMGSNQVNEINWISTARDLVVGTSGGELTLQNSSTGALSASTIQQKARTYHGSEIQQVQNVKEEILFIQSSGTKLRTFRYDFNLDGYTGENLNFLSQHLADEGIKEIVYAQEPETLVYAVTDEGNMLVGTYDRSKKILGWTKYTTDGTFENVQSITRGTQDEVWVIVKRTINSNTRRYIERFTQADGTDDTDGFSDSYLTLSTPLTITGITAADPAVVTSASHGLSDGDNVIIKDLVDPLASDLDSSKTNMSSLNGCTFKVANKTANTFELNDSGDNNIDTSGYNAYGSGGNAFKKVTSITGLDHLEGKTVQVKVDGAIQPDETVSSGAITLDASAGEVVIGLEYTTTIKTLGHEFDMGLGSMQGQKTRWARPLLRVYKSTSATLNGKTIPTRTGNMLMNKKVPLFSGFLEYGPLDWSNSSALTITISDPLPFKLTGVTGTIEGAVK
jgi:hypothetical protein